MTRGPVTSCRSTALPNATVISPPKSRTVVKPAMTVVRAWRVALYAASTLVSSTGSMNDVALISPLRCVCRSMNPGNSVTSPRSITVAPDGSDAGFTAVIRSPVTTTRTSRSIWPEARSSIRAARTTTGCGAATAACWAPIVLTAANKRAVEARRICM